MRMKRPFFVAGKGKRRFLENLLGFMKKFTPDRMQNISDNLLEIAEGRKKRASNRDQIMASELIFKIVLTIHSMMPPELTIAKIQENASKVSRDVLTFLQTAERQFTQAPEEVSKIEAPKETVIENVPTT